MDIETTRTIMCRPDMQNSSFSENLQCNSKVREFLGGIVPDSLIIQKISALQEHWDLHGFGL